MDAEIWSPPVNRVLFLVSGVIKRCCNDNIYLIIFFASFFFMPIGLQLNLQYIALNYPLVLAGTFLVLLSNSFVSAVVFRLLHYDWKQSIYGGALLSQTGEFGIVACTLAYKMKIIGPEFFKAAVVITALSLLCSTAWITLLKKLTSAPAITSASNSMQDTPDTL